MIKPIKKIAKNKLTKVDTELGQVSAQIINSVLFPLQPKERIQSIGWTIIETKMCTQLSYRRAAEMLNLVYHKSESETVKLRTLSDNAIRIGKEITNEVMRKSESVLKMYGFNAETGLVEKGVTLSESVTQVYNSNEDAENRLGEIQNTINAINDIRDEKIPFKSEEIYLESKDNCVYISVDDVGVKHQKDVRKSDVNYEKDGKYVENTVAHIQAGDETYILTAVGMRNLFKILLAFLLTHDFLSKEIIFFTDGAKNIKSNINEMFAFHSYSIVLDWFHLKKRCQEYLSMSIKGKDKRNSCLEKTLRYLWVGDVTSAISYLSNIPEGNVKKQKWLDELIAYLERKRECIVCYAVRAKLNFRNSSNQVEKANDIIVAKRQKHNGMAWTPKGSSSLAAIEFLYHNDQAYEWFFNHSIPMLTPNLIACA